MSTYFTSSSPAVVFVHLVLILHPCVSVYKELQEGEDGHEGECYERHCRGEQEWAVFRLNSLRWDCVDSCEGHSCSPYLSHRWLSTPRSSRELWEMRPAPWPGSEPSSWLFSSFWQRCEERFAAGVTSWRGSFWGLLKFVDAALGLQHREANVHSYDWLPGAVCHVTSNVTSPVSNHRLLAT